jgi:hypothetical protein
LGGSVHPGRCPGLTDSSPSGSGERALKRLSWCHCRQKTFFSVGDYAAYLELLAEWCGKCGVDVWAYCLMPNHVHLVAVPAAADAPETGHRRGDD